MDEYAPILECAREGNWNGLNDELKSYCKWWVKDVLEVIDFEERSRFREELMAEAAFATLVECHELHASNGFQGSDGICSGFHLVNHLRLVVKRHLKCKLWDLRGFGFNLGFETVRSRKRAGNDAFEPLDPRVRVPFRGKDRRVDEDVVRRTPDVHPRFFARGDDLTPRCKFATMLYQRACDYDDNTVWAVLKVIWGHWPALGDALDHSPKRDETAKQLGFPRKTVAYKFDKLLLWLVANASEPVHEEAEEVLGDTWIEAPLEVLEAAKQKLAKAREKRSKKAAQPKESAQSSAQKRSLPQRYMGGTEEIAMTPDFAGPWSPASKPGGTPSPRSQGVGAKADLPSRRHPGGGRRPPKHREISMSELVASFMRGPADFDAFFQQTCGRRQNSK